MSPNPSSELVSMDPPDHPEFTVEPLVLDHETAIEHICEEIKGIALTETDVGTKIRTTGGKLLAILVRRKDESGIELHYRTAPASATSTLKARKIWRILEPFAE